LERLRTAIISDLHLGSSRGEDILRDSGIRASLLAEIEGADRLVLLGDAIEMRDLPLPGALAAARPVLEDLGRALGGGEIVICPGNHDHRLAEPLLEGREAAGERDLGLEQLAEPQSGPGTSIASCLGDALLRIAYPGIWVREDVYATHGHYMDCHMSLPRIECIAAALMTRVFRAIPERATPSDYERVLRPIYGFSFGLAQAGLVGRSSGSSERAWQTISGQGGPRSALRRWRMRALLGAGVPAIVWTLNRLLRAEFDPELSAAAITRSGIAAATELATRLGLRASHVIMGHTHRPGPDGGDREWVLPGGGRLHNTGSWAFASALHQVGTPPGPYWPGIVTWVEDEGAPRRIRLLDDRSREDLRAVVRGLRRSHSSH
jgi:hypothetical protein